MDSVLPLEPGFAKVAGFSEVSQNKIDTLLLRFKSQLFLVFSRFLFPKVSIFPVKLLKNSTSKFLQH